jgi:hypothetical protein
MISEVRQIQKTYCSHALILAIAVALIMIIFGAKPIGKGLLLGTLFSILNFILMAAMLPMRMNQNKKKSSLASFGSIWFRFALLALPLFLAIRAEAFNFFATATGLFMMQIIILSHHLLGIVKAARAKHRAMISS